ncbi:adenine phosphoribosyltransferase [Rothia sp. 110740021-2]
MSVPASEASRTPIEQLIPAACATIPNYPHEGILFYDVTTLFANAEVFKACIDELAARFEGQFDVAAGVEARGFLLASALAYATGTGIMTVRKAGKLPRETYREEYALEYGSAAIEIHCNDFAPGTRVLLLDDLLATGGTLVAAAKLVERANLKVAGVGALLELEGLGGREALDGYRLETLSLVCEYPLPSK